MTEPTMLVSLISMLRSLTPSHERAQLRSHRLVQASETGPTYMVVPGSCVLQHSVAHGLQGLPQASDLLVHVDDALGRWSGPA